MLRAAIAKMQLSWPQFTVDPDVFVSFLRERVPDGAAPSALLRLNLDDLYLTCAVLRGAPGALSCLEGIAMPHIRAIALRLGMPESEAEELDQVLRERLLVGGPGRPPRLSQYRGQGPLRGWLAIAAMREVRARMQASRRWQPLRDANVESLLTEDLELSQIKAQYRAAFREAFRDALRSLGVRDRSLLLYQVVEGLSVEEIAVLYRVHRVTVSRWLGAIRARLLKTTRQNLMQRLHIGDLEVESLLRLINSQMEITLDRCLREDPP